jgi:DNA replication protein DnaC
MITDLQTVAQNCEQHGEYVARQLWAKGRFNGCPTCDAERRSAEQIAEQERVRGYVRKDLLNASGLVGRYLAADFDTFQALDKRQRDVLAACKQFAETLEPGTWSTLWLIGQCGTGKTHLLAAMVRHVINEREMGGVYSTSRGMIRRLRDTWKNDAKESHDGVLRHFVGAPLLALDEMGVGFGTDAELTQLLDVIDGRYSRCLPTVIASNLNTEGLRAALGDRIFDRLREGARMLPMTWESYR